MGYFSNIQLSNFRNYDSAELNQLSEGFVVLSGKNGSGKTNILEALSLFSPGRGLRKVAPSDLQKNDKPVNGYAWAINASITSNLYGAVPAGIGLNPLNNKKISRLKGVDVKSQSEISEYIELLWLTPQMDGLFIGSISDRRRFFDRMIFTAHDKAHAGRITRYDNAMRQRSKILQEENNPDPVWLDGLERDMAETAVALSATRLDFIFKLNAASRKFEQDENLISFPLGTFKINGFIEEELLNKKTALEIEDEFIQKLKNSRKQDGIRGGASIGPHKSDFSVTHLQKNMLAEHCSTGEQKSLLVSIVLSYGLMLQEQAKQMPVLLLDEVAAHLDTNRQKELYDLLNAMGGQVWLTGTDQNIFEETIPNAQFFTIDNGSIILP